LLNSKSFVDAYGVSDIKRTRASDGLKNLGYTGSQLEDVQRQLEESKITGLPALMTSNEIRKPLETERLGRTLSKSYVINPLTPA
jgi:hypothetical protein